ncbi:peptidoglycan-binding protein [Streptomyces sp. ME01-24h]|nr:peptidoglycan-binding protein [Streptomyces sp. ME01-24h]
MTRSADHRLPRRRRRRLTVALAVLLTAGGAGGAAAWSARQGGPQTAPEHPVRLDTVKVTRTDLSTDRTLPGTLGYGPLRTLKGTGPGVLTKLPSPGATAVRGKPLYRVNDQPVTVFLGDTPFFRALDKPGLRGQDVTVLADNLRALGYDIGHTTDHAPTRYAPGGTEFTVELSAALKRWQRDTGQEATGTLTPGRALVLPGPARVNSVTAIPGDPAEGEVLTYTTTAKSVAVNVDAAEVGALRTGQSVTITLPDSREIPGTVTSVAGAVQGGSAEDQTAQAGPPTVAVTVTPRHATDVKGLDSASVQVRFTATDRKGVLAVPVTALLALSEGGYALQRPDSTLVPVETGVFADGMVEVSGAGVSEGMTVVTAS